MNAFEYARPQTAQEAVGMLAPRWGEVEILAGGTDLLSLMKGYLAMPKRVVSLQGVKELGGIRASASGVSIGAMVTLQELHDNKAVHDGYHSLAQAAEGVASPQIRNMRTVAGDLCQRPRCWYYRNGFGLLALGPDGQSLVPNGENQYHAILGNQGPAYFVSPSGLAPGLVTFGAKLRILGPKGKREVAIADFYRIPQKEGEREYALEPNEIITEVFLPAASQGLRSSTYEVRQKLALDWPLATASVALGTQGNTVTSARIVLGQVAPTPWPAQEAEKWLVGKTVTEETAAKAGEAAVAGARPLSKNKYKVQLARVAVKRALLAAVRLQRMAAKGGD